MLLLSRSHSRPGSQSRLIQGSPHHFRRNLILISTPSSQLAYLRWILASVKSSWQPGVRACAYWPEQDIHNNLRNYSNLNNQLHSPFLRLPAELRNQIYQLAFANTTIKLIFNNNDSNIPTCPGCHFCTQLRRLRGVSLLLTCRQIYIEARSFLLPNATFDVREIGIEGFVAEYGKEQAAQVTSIVCWHSEIWRGPWPQKRYMESLGASDHPIKALVALTRVRSISSFAYGISNSQNSMMRDILDRFTGGRVHAGTLEYVMVSGVDR